MWNAEDLRRSAATPAAPLPPLRHPDGRALPPPQWTRRLPQPLYPPPSPQETLPGGSSPPEAATPSPHPPHPTPLASPRPSPLTHHRRLAAISTAASWSRSGSCSTRASSLAGRWTAAEQAAVEQAAAEEKAAARLRVGVAAAADQAAADISSASPRRGAIASGSACPRRPLLRSPRRGVRGVIASG